jgi:hypothetical protein
MKLNELKNSNIWMSGFFEDEAELSHNFNRLSFFSSKEKAAKDLIETMIKSLVDADFEESTKFSTEDGKLALKKNDVKLLNSMADNASNFINEEFTEYIVIFEQVKLTA